MYDVQPGAVLNFDMYRAMAGSAVDMHTVEDDDLADLGGVIKYMHTEILTESFADPLRTTRKYGIDVVTRHRFKIRNTDKLLQSKETASMGEFGQFVTYDWGQATNVGQMQLFMQFGDFVGVQSSCADLHCDVRWPATLPYSWFSAGNFCPNLTWDKKGTKSSPSPGCIRDYTGNVVTGGLCPNGFDMNNFVPGVDPSGTPGCVYSYGKAEVVSLDDLVGITRQDCVGRKCENWLHFRQNCTDPRLRRKFTLSGEVVDVDYCVEFDIHPTCGNCDDAACKALIKSGKEVYLGLPFWHGRCNRQANLRRMEQVAAAFGIPGALSNHMLVEQTMLNTAAACPRSKGTSFACAPEIAGMAGPYCTRLWNGACQGCWIPGVLNGPDPAFRPWCPLDIFHSPSYSDRRDFPALTCKSKRASDGCCLYAGDCEGSSDPNVAPLDDDGFALVASRRNTADMEVFLRRAASGYPALSNAEAVKWTSYFAWEHSPIGRSLADVLDELKLFAGMGAPIITQTSAIVTSAQQQGAVTTHGGCFELAVSFMPLDMDGTVGSIEASAEACQHRCANQQGCRHFSFMQTVGLASGLCHVHDLFAVAQLGSVGYVSGPYACWEDLDDTRNLIDKGHKTFVSPEFACMEWGVVYSPSLPGSDHIIATAEGSNEQAVLQCQVHCENSPECENFVFSLPTRMCSLTGKGAMKMFNMIGAIAGAGTCGKQQKQAFYRLFNDAKPVARGPSPRAPLTLSAGSVLLAAAAALVTISRARPRPTQRAMVLGACRREDLDEEESRPALF